MFQSRGDARLMSYLKKYYTPDMKPEKRYYEADLDEALEIAGVGKYQILHCILMVATLAAALLEIIGNAFILPAAACDLDLPDHLKGIITSVPNIGVILTAPLWGRAADSCGRKPVLLLSCTVAGTIGVAASFMPTVASYAVCKFFTSLFLSCPSSLGWAYIGEMLPNRRRDSIMLTCNGFLMMSSIFSPIIAWVVLSYEWQYFDGTPVVRSWRLLTAAYALPLLVMALGLLGADESPKFLVSSGKNQIALQVLRRVYAVNTGLPEEHYCVTSLRPDDSECMQEQRAPGVVVTKRRGDSLLDLLRPPHVKWLLLTGFLMFGLFSLLNGLFLLAPDTINKIMSNISEGEGTICIFMDQPSVPINETTTPSCVDTITHDTFVIMVTTTLAYSLLVMLVYLSPLHKKTLLIGMFTTVGVACLISGLQENRIVAGVAMSSLQLTALGVGPLTAYAVHLFPTSLRGTAVGAVLMFGRLGSVVGANAAGYFLSVACTGTFYGFAALLFLCAALSFLLPREHSAPPNDVLVNRLSR